MKGVHKATHLVFDDLEVAEFNISYYNFYTVHLLLHFVRINLVQKTWNKTKGNYENRGEIETLSSIAVRKERFISPRTHFEV